MGTITGEEKPAEMLALVYGMEEGMRTFYEELARRAEDEALAALFRKLSEVEVEHKQMLVDLYTRRFPDQAAVETLEARAQGATAEGGMSTEELIEAHGTHLRSADDVLMLAMSLETQALDLYLRYVQKSGDPETKAVLNELADEEKTHLGSLGELLEKSAQN